MGRETYRALVVETCAALAVVAATAFTSARIEAGAAAPVPHGLARVAFDAAGVLPASRPVAGAAWTPALGALAGAGVVDRGRPWAYIDRLFGSRPAAHAARSRPRADRRGPPPPSRPAAVPAS